MWEEDWENPFPQHEQPRQYQQQNHHFDFDFFSLLSKPKDYYGILELDFDATEDDIRSSYIKLALRWHPDKRKDGDSSSTSRFQEINEAYQVLSNPVTRSEYDLHRMQHVYDRNIIEYLHRNRDVEEEELFSLMTLQVTIFPSYGIRIELTYRHVLADGRNFHHFIKTWLLLRGT